MNGIKSNWHDNLIVRIDLNVTARVNGDAPEAKWKGTGSATELNLTIMQQQNDTIIYNDLTIGLKRFKPHHWHSINNIHTTN